MSDPIEDLNQIKAEIQGLSRRLTRLEDAKLADAQAIGRLQNAITDLEIRIERVSLGLQGLANSLEKTNTNINEWRQMILDLAMKIARLEERSVNMTTRFDKMIEHTADLDARVAQGFADVNKNLAVVAASVQREATRTSEEVRNAMPIKPEVAWYKDAQRLKEIGGAIAIIVMTALTMMNTAKVDSLPSAPVDTKAVETGK